ncbi:MAG: hypothetical protein HGJ97_17415 [Desulfosporosinus sp.]|nr:hypothetical protein [Desulfosporosinus sp.]
MKRQTKPKGFGIAATVLLAALFMAVAIAPAMGAVEDAADGNGTRDTVNLGSLFTDGEEGTASATCVGDVTVQAGYNTFCVQWENINDKVFDGHGAKFEVKVWDANGGEHIKTKTVNKAGSGTLCVSFDSLGTGDAQYEIYCDTHTLFNIVDSDNCVAELEYT